MIQACELQVLRVWGNDVDFPMEMEWNIGFKYLNRNLHKPEENVMGDNKGEKFVYFLTGVSIGALAGVLFAPQSGKRTRELIANQAGESSEYLFQKGRELREQAAECVKRGKGVLAEKREHLVSAVAAGREAYQAEPKPKNKR
jgi:gas vesicle protein